MRARPTISAAALATAIACTQPQPAPPPPPTFTPTLSIKELMEHIVDPIADWVFDAVAVDVGPKGIIETKPETEEAWRKVEDGALILAEASNLLKMKRLVAPPGDEAPSEDGTPSPELSTSQIQAKIDARDFMESARRKIL